MNGSRFFEIKIESVGSYDTDRPHFLYIACKYRKIRINGTGIVFFLCLKRMNKPGGTCLLSYSQYRGGEYDLKNNPKDRAEVFPES